MLRVIEMPDRTRVASFFSTILIAHTGRVLPVALIEFGVFVELVNAVQERCSGGVHLLFCSRVTMQKLNALWKSLSHFGVPLPSHLEKLPFKVGVSASPARILGKILNLILKIRVPRQQKRPNIGLGQVACNFVFRSSTLDEDEMQAIIGGIRIQFCRRAHPSGHPFSVFVPLGLLGGMERTRMDCSYCFDLSSVEGKAITSQLDLVS